ncbi:glycosyltransferase 87 family protein, partial [Actinoplanes sp. RD1]|uniref:glycosyltransferase 87 family protein n=1 Tax=Actinoplanes sp. RD1 TaxID=3064538 RepID=UPI002741EAE4
MPATRTPAHPAIGRSVVVTLACAGILAAISTIAQRYGFSTLAVARGAVGGGLDGLYAYRAPGSHLGTDLTPPAALLMAPAAVLPLAVAGWLLALAGVAALALALIVQAGPIARRHGRRPWPVVLAVGALGLTLEPIRAVLGLGTLDLLAYGLVTADLVALHRAARTRRWAGVGIGLATRSTPSPSPRSWASRR